MSENLPNYTMAIRSHDMHHGLATKVDFGKRNLIRFGQRILSRSF